MMRMEYLDMFPEWEKLVEYYENSTSEFAQKRKQTEGRSNFEDLLNKEAYRLWKLLNQM